MYQMLQKIIAESNATYPIQETKKTVFNKKKL